MSGYRCRWFGIEELVPRAVCEALGERAWWLLDDLALVTLDALRARYGVATVNNWALGGGRENAGLRVAGSGVGARFSQHLFGRAFDVVFRGVEAAEVRADVLANPALWPHIHAIEDGVSWFHFDRRNCAPIMVFKP